MWYILHTALLTILHCLLYCNVYSKLYCTKYTTFRIYFRFVFASYNAWKKHSTICLLKPPKDWDEGPNFHLLGTDKEKMFRNIHGCSSERVKMMTCVATSSCVRGVFPLIFLPQGTGTHGGRLDWLGEEVGRLGEDNYSVLREAVREVDICLPDRLTVVLHEGGSVFLPRSLLHPRSKSRYCKH
jgi:hypothetical protein